MLSQPHKLQILIKQLSIGQRDWTREEKSQTRRENWRDASPETFVAPLIFEDVLGYLKIWGKSSFL